MKTRKEELRVDRFIVPYRVYGDGDTAIVCVSGAQQTMAAWRPFVTRFARQHAVVVFDPPGLGRSQILGGDAQVSLSEQVRVLQAVHSPGFGEKARHRCSLGGGAGVHHLDRNLAP